LWERLSDPHAAANERGKNNQLRDTLASEQTARKARMR